MKKVLYANELPTKTPEEVGPFDQRVSLFVDFLVMRHYNGEDWEYYTVPYVADGPLYYRKSVFRLSLELVTVHEDREAEKRFNAYLERVAS